MFLFATVALLQVGAFEGDSRVWLGLIGGGLLILFFGISFLVKQYKRCPSNRILVIYGGSRAHRRHSASTAAASS